jgi:hypothetical protein
MVEFRTLPDQRLGVEDRPHAVFLPENDEAGVGAAFGNLCQSRNDGFRSVVTAHGVD